MVGAASVVACAMSHHSSPDRHMPRRNLEMPTIRIDPDESDRLVGLSLLAQVLYTRLRERVNYETKIVGGDPRYPLRLGTLASLCAFNPDRGSRRPAWKPERAEMRAALGELKRAGMIERPLDAPRHDLVFRLLLADTNSRAQMRNDQGATKERPTGNDQAEAQRKAVSSNGATGEQPGSNRGGATIIPCSKVPEEDIPNGISKRARDARPSKKRTAKKTSAKSEALDYSSWPSMPSPQVFEDWLAMRRRKRAHVSQTVVNRFGAEMHRAKAQGYSVDDCLSKAVARDWTGFEAEWMSPRRPVSPPAAHNLAGKNYQSTPMEDIPWMT